jgi:hypothetical protein
VIDVYLVRALSSDLATGLRTFFASGYPVDNSVNSTVFDLFLIADKKLRYQQKLKGRRSAILVLPSNRPKLLRTMIAQPAD